MGFLLWLVAAFLVIWGLVTILKGAVILGLLLILVGCLVGPGGWSIFKPYDR